MNTLIIMTVSALLGAMPLHAKTLTIGVDLSASNPLVVSSPYAQGVAKLAAAQVAALQPGDVVEVRTFGDGSLANAPVERIRITRRDRADKVAGRVAGFIASIPSQQSLVQGSTGIVGWLEFGSFDCGNGGEVLLLTDGIESSDYIDAEAFLAGKKLPAAEKDILKGCTVTMIGVGQSAAKPLPPTQIKHVRDSWRVWMAMAGATFKTIFAP